MLKKICVVAVVLILSACGSQPADKRFKGAGDFDKVEAAKTRVSLGLTYLKNGSFSQAKFNLDRALEFDPRSGQANFAMAFYYQQVDEVTRAHEYYKQAIDYSNNDPDVLNSYGAFLCKQGDYEQAKRYFLRAVDDKRYVSTAQTYENLAICAQSQGKIEEAIAYFDSALNHQPTRASSLLFVSQLYMQTNQFDAAKRSLFKYERSAGVSKDSLWLLFQIAQGQNDVRAAVEYSELLRTLYPSYPNTAKALEHIGKFQANMAITQKIRPDNNARSQVGDIPASSTITMDDIAASNAANLASQNESKLASESTKMTLIPAVDIPDEVATQQRQFHIVQAKENLYRISLKYNVKIRKLLEWNNLEDAPSIRIGTKLWVKEPI
jgi:type IV pilus assembly protein PilF